MVMHASAVCFHFLFGECRASTKKALFQGNRTGSAPIFRLHSFSSDITVMDVTTAWTTSL